MAGSSLSQAMSNLIGDIYECAMSGDWEPVLHQIKNKTRSNKAFFLLQSTKTQQPLKLELVCDFEFPSGALIEYQKQPFTDDPCFQTTRLLSEGEAHFCNNFIDLSEMKSDSYFQNVFVPMKAYYVLVGVCCRNNEYDATLAVNRDECDPAYDDNDIAFLELLMPHLTRACHIYIELKNYKEKASLASKVLNHAEKAMLVCDKNRELILANTLANKILNQSSVFQFENNRVTLSDYRFKKQFEALCKQACDMSFQSIKHSNTLLFENEFGQSFRFTVSPIFTQDKQVKEAACLVTVQQGSSINWSALKQEYSLSVREIELIEALYGKRRLPDLAVELGVSYHTLRSHLRAIFKKMRINSQSELMQKINLFS